MKHIFFWIGTLASAAVQAQGAITVKNSAELHAAVGLAKAGSTILIAPGNYSDAMRFSKVQGHAERPIVIAGADPKSPPVFSRGLQFSNAAHLELRDLQVSGVARSNGLNFDDGGVFETPAHHIALLNLTIRDIGPVGNFDGIKLSGVEEFRIENCRIEKWGAGSGSGVDMVGCHRGVILNNTFVHDKELKTTGGSAVQAKGGSRDIKIRGNRFEHAGQRAVNIGGSTGAAYFRPPLEKWPDGEEKYEAKNISVEGNTFIGGMTPLAFVGVDGALARFNTIYLPGRWAMRILQETTQPGFAPSRGGVVSDNIVVFQSANWAEGGVNIGPNTRPQSFVFARNYWFCEDSPDRSRPTLPSAEAGGIHGQNPQFENAAAGDLRLKNGSPALKFGAGAWSEMESREKS